MQGDCLVAIWWGWDADGNWCALLGKVAAGWVPDWMVGRKQIDGVTLSVGCKLEAFGGCMLG